MSKGQAQPVLSRRRLLQTGAGAAAAAAATGASGVGAAQSGEPFDGYLSDVSNFDGTLADMTGQDSVTITVGAAGNNGNFAFGPPAVRVDPGTTVVWEWNGKGGAHNVVAEDESYNSGDAVTEQGTTFEYTFESEGVSKYYCVPHKSLGMKAVVVVGDADVGVPSGSGGDGGDGGDGGTATPTTKEVPDLGGYLDDVSNFDGTVTDRTGQDEVTVTVGAAGNNGNFAFGPAAIHVDAGTTVVWEWNGKGGGHNVVAEDESFDSGDAVAEQGTTFEYTFESDGITQYFCVPHKSLGMKGAVVVGSDYPTKEITVTPSGGGGGDAGGGETPTPEPSAGNQTAAMTLVAMLGLGFLSPIVFAILLRLRRDDSGPPQ